jgi:ComF family protein
MSLHFRVDRVHVSRIARIACRRARRTLIDTLLPPLCPGCRCELASGRWLCTDCRRALRAAPDGPICIACRAEQRPRGDREAGYHCRRPDHVNLHGRAAWWMEEPLDAIVHGFKYEGRDDVARALARILVARIPVLDADGVTAVPLHRTRRRERGYNQAALLGREAAIRWGIPWVPDLLERARATRPQARLAETDRAANVAFAFRPIQPGWVQGRTWVLIDDVVTTAMGPSYPTRHSLASSSAA